ncbi:uncharacterized protein HKW66_Vig0163290 [Vigna angularis]|uniref:Uncharacterized protein n=1 Tax=Phaseolus angularis TaxID=3914 RepID=A0A8T0JK72_PHAAN|nr:uncharacterized protein HKW66_Vig0163290 [Vigna angularis]
MFTNGLSVALRHSGVAAFHDDGFGLANGQQKRSLLERKVSGSEWKSPKALLPREEALRSAGGDSPPIGNALVPKGQGDWWNEKEEGKRIDEKKNLLLMLRLKLLLLWLKKAKVKESETCTLKKLAYPLVF